MASPGAGAALSKEGFRHPASNFHRTTSALGMAEEPRLKTRLKGLSRNASRRREKWAKLNYLG